MGGLNGMIEWMGCDGIGWVDWMEWDGMIGWNGMEWDGWIKVNGWMDGMGCMGCDG